MQARFLKICQLDRLIDLYFKNGFVNSARKVFDKLWKRDNVSWISYGLLFITKWI